MVLSMSYQVYSVIPLRTSQAVPIILTTTNWPPHAPHLHYIPGHGTEPYLECILRTGDLGAHTQCIVAITWPLATVPQATSSEGTSLAELGLGGCSKPFCFPFYLCPYYRLTLLWLFHSCCHTVPAILSWPEDWLYAPPLCSSPISFSLQTPP